MKNKIIENINNPELLEELYRTDKNGFEKAFLETYPEISETKISNFWKVRLAYENIKEDSIKIKKTDILFLILSCAIAGFLIEIPKLFGINVKEYFFYAKNAALIVFLGLTLFAFLTKDLIKPKQLLIIITVFIISAIYVNLLPSNKDSRSINLVYIHLPIMIGLLYALIYMEFDISDKSKRIDFIKHSGDLAIMSGIILIAIAFLGQVTIGLFLAIELKIQRFYVDYIFAVGLVSTPIIATYVIRAYPSIVNKVAPIIANILRPLVLITLIIYLISIIATGKDPYNNRNFLMVFNFMLLGVMGIMVFSISETSINRKQRFNEIILFALSIVTLIIDLVALSAILYRLGEYGFTPNRIAVLGSNLLIFVNLILIMFDLYRVNFKNKEIKQVELTIAKYLPVYAIWIIFVVFALPVIFGLK